MIFKNHHLANDQNYVIFATAVYLVLVVMHFFSYEKKNNKISDPRDITRAPKLHLLVQIFWGKKGGVRTSARVCVGHSHV